MKIWITFNTVFSLQCGGLERCQVWWQKPQYVVVDKTYDYDDLPFGGANITYKGLTRIGWRYAITQGQETGSVSLGKIFNYDGDICDYVWEELCKFFQSDDLREWDEQAKKLKLKPQQFMLELDVDFKLNYETKPSQKR